MGASEAAPHCPSINRRASSGEGMRALLGQVFASDSGLRVALYVVVFSAIGPFIT